MALMVKSNLEPLQSEAGPSRLAYNASTSLHTTYACHLDQLDGAPWFNSHDKTSTTSCTNGNDDGTCSSIADQYAEALWLGEFHTSLSHFLECVDRLKSSHDFEAILLGLCHLIKSISAISKRHQAAASKIQLSPEDQTEVRKLDTEELSQYESLLVRRAVEKAGSTSESAQAASMDLDSLRERWASSMESREIQLQILVTVCLLHLVSQEPRALETARSRMSGISPSGTASDAPPNVAVVAVPETEGDQPRKRSRKLEKAKRWRGARPDASDAFAWNQQRRRLTTDSSHDDGENGEADVLEMEGVDVLAVEHLSKRLEALVDILCLRQVAAGVGSEIADLLSDLGAETISEDHGSNGKAKGKGALFGSSVRKLLKDDDMDDAQWLCSRVVEPHFESSLPRQCSLFRSKCFVSLQSRTPARSTKMARMGSMGSPPMRTAKRSSEKAAAGSSASLLVGGGLSDVLEKEQAGRRVKRNIMAELSSMLGRGREVDMGRRLSRSISATSGPSRESPAPLGVFSRSNNSNTLFSQPNLETATKLEPRKTKTVGLGAGKSMSQRVDMLASMRSSTFSSRPSFAASPSQTSKRLLVMSTPQKEPASKMFDVKSFTGLDKPKLVYPSLVMESPTQDGPRLIGQQSRIAERCASFGGRSSFQLNRSPSPIAFNSDVED